PCSARARPPSRPAPADTARESRVTTLSELMSRCIAAPGSVALDDCGEDWMQGRSVFGGLQAAVALAAMRTLVPDAPLRTLQMAFVAPVGARDLRARAATLRAGKSAT